ncbi:unnamed protein product [Malus baccata var. baccata]
MRCCIIALKEFGEEPFDTTVTSECIPKVDEINPIVEKCRFDRWKGLYWNSIGTESAEESCGGIGARDWEITLPSRTVRVKISPQVAQPHIRTLDYLDYRCPGKGTKMGQQIVSSGLKFLADTSTSVSCEHDFSSWRCLSPAKVIDSSGLQKWEDVLEMFNDLIDWLKNERELLVSVAKLEDVLTDTSTGHKEVRHQESLVQKKLTKTLGYSSKCLFALMLYYLYGHVRDIEVDVRGGVYSCGSENDFCLCMGRIVTSDVVWSGVWQLDRALGIFKFVWEIAGVKGALQVQGHIWCVGAEARVVTYRGNSFFGTRISCLSNDCLTIEEFIEVGTAVERLARIGEVAAATTMGVTQ